MTEQQSRTQRTVHSRVYRNGELIAEDADPAELAEHRRDPETTVLLDLLAPTPDDLAQLADSIGGDIAVEPYLLQSALTTRGRPRILRFADHKLVHTRAVRFDKATQQLRTTSVALLEFPGELVIIRSDAGFAIEDVFDELDDSAGLAANGIAFLVHAVLDQLVTGYLDALDEIDVEILAVEDDLLEGNGPGHAIQVRTFTLRRAVAALARVALPMTEVLSSVSRTGAHPAEAAMAPYLQDVYEHAVRATERIDGLRDAIESILATSLSMQGNSLNEIMKKLTGWAAIIAIPTGITGYFGQNVPFPGYNDRLGFWLSAALLLGLGFGLWLTFRRRGWL